MDNCCEGQSYVDALGKSQPAGGAETTLEVEGASCGACVARIETALRAVPGVSVASFNLATRRASVSHATTITKGELEAAVARAGYRATTGARRDPARDRRTALWRAGVAGLAMMQVMMLAWPAYIADEGTLTWDQERLLSFAALLLTIPVLAFSAIPIWVNAWRGLRAGHPGMDVPVALGLIAATIASLPATFHGGPVYYESVAMFVFFLATARWFEARALAATVASSEALARLLPRKAVRLTAQGQREAVEPAALVPGDLVWIAAGDAAPADCTLEEGQTDFNEALLTGESAPAAKRAGDAILAGSVNLSAPVRARVTRAGEEQTLSVVRRLVERAAASKPRWALLADRYASHFVVGVVLLAAIAAVAWSFIDPARALPVAMAVLVVSCPCALSLATPVALTASANALAARGVLVTDGAAIERLADIDRVVFDKTGTLTTGRLRIATIDVLGDVDELRCLQIAAALEQAMPHPIAHALVASGARPLAVKALLAVPGAGVEARLDGVVHRVGSAQFCREIAGEPPTLPPEDDSPRVALVREGAWLAVIRFDDTLRTEAPEVIARLRELGVESSLVSGDRAPVVDRVARATRITHAVSAASPDDKLQILEGFRATGEKVAMVGDGVNDAPSLAAAHVAIALGQGAALAQSQAGLVLINPSLMAIPEAIETARRTRRVIAQNLAWAAGYNLVTIPLAAAGVLAPWMASLGMSVSSLLVVLNALRIARPKR
ncbi:heavy metal translocating P-type ATPase [Usitatibacter palustris]|uniref:Copper-exporting P-type ATPase n=1 Tax=Usitatibacter palustris TaxID=2732487 RepID=A0A6M4H6Z9_9PROT|nr:cation-translocating P-type ATPase [Usitatibacter palustris]QJR14174.1 Copper-exporting P-type ATPase [Usitatibacter palustris]